jgi:hypothetical protein
MQRIETPGVQNLAVVVPALISKQAALQRDRDSPDIVGVRVPHRDRCNQRESRPVDDQEREKGP